MKIRHGYVSNSSSSSFVVAFPKKPKNIKEVKDLMFKNKETFTYYDKEYTTLEIAEKIFQEIEFQDSEKPPIKISKNIIDCIEVGGDINLIIKKFYQNKTTKEQEELIDYLEIIKSNYDCSNMNFLKKNKNKFIVKFTFSDENGDFWSMMEHGNIFYNLPYEQESHH